MWNVEVKSFECVLCSAKFSYKQNLNKHLRLHTGDIYPAQMLQKLKNKGVKPYKCDKCPSMFSDKSNFNSHKRRHTGFWLYWFAGCSFMPLSLLN